MKELSLNILDIAKNSIKANATFVKISLTEDVNGILTLTITDNGDGMTNEELSSATNPFFTTRKERNVGLGIPLLKLASEQSGGKLTIVSKSKKEYGECSGTSVCATFDTTNIDCKPLGNISQTITTLLQGSPSVNFEYSHKTPEKEISLSSYKLKNILGNVPINSYEVLNWISEYLNEQYEKY